MGEKLDAFLERFKLPGSMAARAVRSPTSGTPGTVGRAAEAWPAFEAALPTLAEHGERWVERLEGGR